ncbi:hypothetical protein SAMN05216464_110198 [Mucilaginibacter pineti]|uniref:Uncharacterized protein n=1 Tax=Mucilaginibacter pineti TaxID=1391627 RepID=A0A1G7GL90_9SPHI|nr:hypothetical protein [Mucilaginibacter pineti]SDE88896.1 hypothetical protein SAMN05216464_110198 [Mucilaginibacter pineti]
MQKITSRFLSLNTQDFFKGLIVTVASAVFALVAESVEKGQFTFDYTSIWHTAVAAGMAYLGKQFFTPAQAVISIQ